MKRFFGWIVGAILTLATVGLQAAKTPEEITTLQSQAARGNSEASYQLGLCYANGDGVPQDFRQVLYWWRKAAEQGHSQAQCEMGMAYANGLPGFLQKDCRQALYWYHRAAEQGHSDAQYILGDAYSSGNGVQKDCQQALYWFRKAAEQGHAGGQIRLSEYYYSPILNFTPAARLRSLPAIFCGGRGPNAPGEAVEWLRKALSSQFSSQEQRNAVFANCYLNMAMALYVGNQAYINTIAPVVREYDPMFDAHMREAVNLSRRMFGTPPQRMLPSIRSCPMPPASRFGTPPQRMLPSMPSSRGGSCSHCGGSGLDPTRIRWAGYYGGAVRREYCSICNSTTELHSHYTCGVCHGVSR